MPYPSKKKYINIYIYIYIYIYIKIEWNKLVKMKCTILIEVTTPHIEAQICAYVGFIKQKYYLVLNV